MQRSSGSDRRDNRLNTSYGLGRDKPDQSQVQGGQESLDASRGKEAYEPRPANPFALLNKHRGSIPSLSVDPATYLAQLEESRQPDIPLGAPRITTATGKLQRKPKDAYTSKEIGGSNNDCVLAAFKSIDKSISQKPYLGMMTSSDEVIKYLAGQYRLSEVNPSDLSAYLRNGKRAFISAESLDGKNYHAYAALGVDEKTGKIIAWDTDNYHANIKLVPTEKVWLAYAYR